MMEEQVLTTTRGLEMNNDDVSKRLLKVNQKMWNKDTFRTWYGVEVP